VIFFEDMDFNCTASNLLRPSAMVNDRRALAAAEAPGSESQSFLPSGLFFHT
jgi:hypothetical protein